MNNNLRILYNTIILYVRIIVCSGLSLWTIPLALSALGQSDFGLYNLIAGVLSMLAFVSSSMAIASQRYISVSIGSHDVTRINMAYNISLRLHFLLAIFVIILFEIVYPFLFNGMLNIQPERIKTAQLLYQIMMISTVSTIVSVPFDSIMFAHENMVVPSLIAILDAINKLVVVVFISTLDIDRLLIYGIGLTFITLLNVFLKYLFVKFKYRQYYFSIDSFDKSLFQEMFAYAGWSSVGSLSQLGRNQGVALVLNFFCGTVVNAAYGIANQINAVLLSFTGSIQTAISPQLMQREGAKDRKGMLSMSLVLIKISTTIFNLIAVPLILEMPYILKETFLFNKIRIFLNRERKISLGKNYPEVIFYVIGHTDKVGGLFWIVNKVLMHLSYAEEHNYIPIVDFKNYATQYQAEGLLHQENIWEYLEFNL